VRIRRFIMEDWLASFKDACRYNLGESGMPDITVGGLLERCGLSADILEDIVLRDHDTRGTGRLRRAIRASYGNDAALENITVTTGTSEALFILFNLLMEGRRRVVAPMPSFQALYEVPRALGAELRTYRLDDAGGFVPDPDEVCSLIDDSTGAVVLNTPHNPSGVCIPDDIARSIVDKAAFHGAWVISDEHYRFLPHDAPAPLRTFARFGGNVVATGSITKCFGLIGLRVGWIAAPESLIGGIRDFRDYLTHTLSPVSDFLAAVSLEHAGLFTEPAIRTLRENRRRLVEMAGRTPGLSLVTPDAGVVAFPRFSYRISSDDFARGLIERHGIFVLPGSAFETDGHVRINLGMQPAVFGRALEGLSAWCRSLPGETAGRGAAYRRAGKHHR